MSGRNSRLLLKISINFTLFFSVQFINFTTHLIKVDLPIPLAPQSKILLQGLPSANSCVFLII